MKTARTMLFERSKNLRETAGPKEIELSTLESRIQIIDERTQTLKRTISKRSDQRKKAFADYRKALGELSKIGAVSKEDEERALAKARAPLMEQKLQEIFSGAGREILRGMTDRALSQCLVEKEERINKRMLYGALESQASIIRNILETGKCLCGTSIGRTGMGRERIKALLHRLEARRDELKELGKEPIWTSDQVLEGVRMCLASPSFDRKRYLSSIKDLEHNQWTLRKSLKKDKSGRIDDLISNVREYERISVLLDRDKDELANLVHERKNSDRKFRKIENELVKLWGVEEGSKGFSDRMDIMDKSIDDLSSLMTRLMDNMREGIEKRANATMRKLDPKGKFGKIRIHQSSYRLGREMNNIGGMKILPMAYLSAGERELMALSVLSSIPGISEGILMLDSPFPYIDSTRRSRIIERLPKISKRVFISLPEGTLTDEEIAKMDEIWSRKGSSLRRYRLEFRKGGSVMIDMRGGRQ
jgi:DNA sulfur modification protein DndD